MSMANLQICWNFPSCVIQSNSWKLPKSLCCYSYFEWEREKVHMNSTRCRHLLCKIILCFPNSTQRWIHAMRWHRCMVCIHKHVVKLIPNQTLVFHVGENVLVSCLCTDCIFRMMMPMPCQPCSFPKKQDEFQFFLSLFWETVVLGSSRISMSKKFNCLIRKTNLANQIKMLYLSLYSLI